MKPTTTPVALRHLDGALHDLDAGGLLRRRSRAPEGSISFCSNDYLGLARRASTASRVGSGASRLVDGDTDEHGNLERALATWLRVDDVLLFSSGYAANVGALSALLAPGDLVVSDHYNHASIIDGIRLAKARPIVVPHLDIAAMEDALRAAPAEVRKWVVVESYYSMDGDSPPLAALRALCDRHGAALVLDEAHALGVFGPEGRGLAAAEGVVADVLVGAFGKAFGTAGGFVAGCSSLSAWLWNRARSFVYSTGMSPALAASTQDALAILRGSSALRDRLASNADTMRALLREAGFAPGGYGPIIPCVVGSSHRAMQWAAALRELGIVIQAIRPPTVPQGTARLRITASARHDAADLQRLALALRAIQRQLADGAPAHAAP